MTPVLVLMAELDIAFGWHGKQTSPASHRDLAWQARGLLVSWLLLSVVAAMKTTHEQRTQRITLLAHATVAISIQQERITCSTFAPALDNAAQRAHAPTLLTCSVSIASQ
jgi:hypothetical protein